MFRKFSEWQTPSKKDSDISHLEQDLRVSVDAVAHYLSCIPDDLGLVAIVGRIEVFSESDLPEMQNKVNQIPEVIQSIQNLVVLNSDLKFSVEILQLLANNKDIGLRSF